MSSKREEVWDFVPAKPVHETYTKPVTIQGIRVQSYHKTPVERMGAPKPKQLVKKPVKKPMFKKSTSMDDRLHRDVNPNQYFFDPDATDPESEYEEDAKIEEIEEGDAAEFVDQMETILEQQDEEKNKTDTEISDSPDILLQGEVGKWFEEPLPAKYLFQKLPAEHVAYAFLFGENADTDVIIDKPNGGSIAFFLADSFFRDLMLNMQEIEKNIREDLPALAAAKGMRDHLETHYAKLQELFSQLNGADNFASMRNTLATEYYIEYRNLYSISDTTGTITEIKQAFFHYLDMMFMKTTQALTVPDFASLENDFPALVDSSQMLTRGTDFKTVLEKIQVIGAPLYQTVEGTDLTDYCETFYKWGLSGDLSDQAINGIASQIGYAEEKKKEATKPLNKDERERLARLTPEQMEDEEKAKKQREKRSEKYKICGNLLKYASKCASRVAAMYALRSASNTLSTFLVNQIGTYAAAYPIIAGLVSTAAVTGGVLAGRHEFEQMGLPPITGGIIGGLAASSLCLGYVSPVIGLAVVVGQFYYNKRKLIDEANDRVDVTALKDNLEQFDFRNIAVPEDDEEKATYLETLQKHKQSQSPTAFTSKIADYFNDRFVICSEIKNVQGQSKKNFIVKKLKDVKVTFLSTEIDNEYSRLPGETFRYLEDQGNPKYATTNQRVAGIALDQAQRESNNNKDLLFIRRLYKQFRSSNGQLGAPNGNERFYGTIEEYLNLKEQDERARLLSGREVYYEGPDYYHEQTMQRRFFLQIECSPEYYVIDWESKKIITGLNYQGIRDMDIETLNIAHLQYYHIMDPGYAITSAFAKNERIQRILFAPLKKQFFNWYQDFFSEEREGRLAFSHKHNLEFENFVILPKQQRKEEYGDLDDQTDIRLLGDGRNQTVNNVDRLFSLNETINQSIKDNNKTESEKIRLRMLYNFASETIKWLPFALSDPNQDEWKQVGYAVNWFTDWCSERSEILLATGIEPVLQKQERGEDLTEVEQGALEITERLQTHFEEGLNKAPFKDAGVAPEGDENVDFFGHNNDYYEMYLKAKPGDINKRFEDRVRNFRIWMATEENDDTEDTDCFEQYVKKNINKEYLSHLKKTYTTRSGNKKTYIEGIRDTYQSAKAIEIVATVQKESSVSFVEIAAEKFLEYLSQLGDTLSTGLQQLREWLEFFAEEASSASVILLKKLVSFPYEFFLAFESGRSLFSIVDDLWSSISKAYPKTAMVLKTVFLLGLVAIPSYFLYAGYIHFSGNATQIVQDIFSNSSHSNATLIVEAFKNATEAAGGENQAIQLVGQYYGKAFAFIWANLRFVAALGAMNLGNLVLTNLYNYVSPVRYKTPPGSTGSLAQLGAFAFMKFFADKYLLT